MSLVKKMVYTSICVALGLVLPMAFHAVQNAGAIFLPMHIPVLLCGLICGWPFGLACGALTPLLSSLLTGMPPAAILPAMLCELAVYGFVTGIMFRLVRTKYQAANIYISLIGAMLAGRLISGVLKALIFNVGEYSVKIWVTASFVTALPGIAIQLLLIPVLVGILTKAGLISTACGTKRRQTSG